MKKNDAIGKIHQFLRFGSVLGLERMNELLSLLGEPQEDLKVIHVAGTNGKGSTCRYLYSVLREAGYKVGMYTSPFLEVFNERIEMDGNYISDEDLAKYTDRVLACVKVMTDAGHDSPTEFEVVTAIAFLYFKEKNCDYVVLEVGLGGRGDSTNVCKSPLMTVITSISMDHMDRLGNTLGEIAREKAGIIKDGCPVVTSAEAEEALAVIENTAEAHQAMYFETRHLPYEIVSESLAGCQFNAMVQGVSFDGLTLSMAGDHQVKNAIGALAALCIMEERGDVVLSREAIYTGFKKARQPGRLEVLSLRDEGKKEPLVLIDGAHNEDGARVLQEAVSQLVTGSRILMVTGILADKDVEKVLERFLGITGDFIATEPDNPRKLAATALAQRIEEMGGSCIPEPDLEKACQLALKKAEDYDGIVFAGSLYMIGAARSILRKKLGKA